MEYVKEDLKDLKKTLVFLVREEGKADAKTDVAVKRLEKQEKERDEQDDEEREASLAETLAHKTKQRLRL